MNPVPAYVPVRVGPLARAFARGAASLDGGFPHRVEAWRLLALADILIVRVTWDDGVLSGWSEWCLDLLRCTERMAFDAGLACAEACADGLHRSGWSA